jgi:hypothetical protein
VLPTSFFSECSQHTFRDAVSAAATAPPRIASQIVFPKQKVFFISLLLGGKLPNQLELKLWQPTGKVEGAKRRGCGNNYVCYRSLLLHGNFQVEK